MTKFDALKKDYSQAVRRLGEVLAMRKTKVIRDSAILRFELCFDLAWKTIKIYLEDVITQLTIPTIILSVLGFIEKPEELLNSIRDSLPFRKSIFKLK